MCSEVEDVESGKKGRGELLCSSDFEYALDRLETLTNREGLY